MAMEGVNKKQLEKFIKAALKEDVGDGDHTSLACIPSKKKDTAKLLVKDDGVLAGVDLARMVFKQLDPKSKFMVFINDGANVKYGDIAFEVTCNAQALLKGERLALNAMQRMSGIATLSRKFRDRTKGTNVKILDTRKTTPLLRFLEKWAVRIGGSHNYRDGLYDWIMIKDNHIDACGSITKAVKRVHKYFKKTKKKLGITVEVRNLKELAEVMKVGGVTRIMLDNFELSKLKKAVKIVGDKFETEASGGVTLKTVKAISRTGVDYISVGALTHSAGCLDLSLKVVRP